MQGLPILGAVNMLVNCGQMIEGERLLIAHEPANLGYYSPGTVECVAEAARGLGVKTEILDVGFEPHAPGISPTLSDAIARADVTVFLARLGDQLRFSRMPVGKRIIVSYAISPEMFASGFGQIDHRAMLLLKQEIDKVVVNSEEIRLTCPAGTDVVGRRSNGLSRSADTTIRRFPVPVSSPVPANGFSGRVALPGFLTGTGSMYYRPYSVEFGGPVHALLRDGRLAGFEGAPNDVHLAERHYDRVSDLYGIDRDFVHSWHAGIHPGCCFKARARDNYERWSGAAFGNPRVLHFHTCGAYAPGEISWNVLDPTITIDGVVLWEDGKLFPERLSGGESFLSEHTELAGLFMSPELETGLNAE